MNSIEVRRVLSASPEAVWALVGDFGGVARWNPFVKSAEVTDGETGMTRVITSKDGARIVERLEALEAADRHIRYGVELESGAQSVADIRLVPAEDGTTEVVWRSLRESEVSQTQRDAILATLSSRIDALVKAIR